MKFDITFDLLVIVPILLALVVIPWLVGVVHIFAYFLGIQI